VSLIGENKETTIIDDEGSAVLYVSANARALENEGNKQE